MAADPDPGGATAAGVSDDGQLVVGCHPHRQFGIGLAFAWTEAAGEFHPRLDEGFLFSSSRALSNDGRRSVGLAGKLDREFRALSWPLTTGLGILTSNGEALPSPAAAVSGDGKVIAGSCRHQAVRWDSGETTWLKTSGAPQASSDAFDGSTDGSTVVGTSFWIDASDSLVTAAMVWSAGGEAHLLSDLLRDAGLGADGMDVSRHGDAGFG